MTTLTGEQRKQLHKALMAAFPGWSELNEMVALQLGRNLQEISAQDKLGTVVLNLIVWAQARGHLAELVAGALAHNPENPELKAFAAAMHGSAPAAPPPPLAEGVAPGPEVKEYYERLVWKAVDFAGTAEFRAAMQRRERAVCRVEVPEGSGEATGFLVGSDLLMTNYHVLEDFIENRQPSSPVAFRFDYQANADGTKVSDGRVVKLASAADWRIRMSEVADLDYALVRLADKAGNDLAPGDTTTRGWLTPVAHQFEIGESVFILQHPKAAPLKIASGGVAQVNDRRVHYLANTLGGSSGSPCFTSDWKLAGLHRGGDSIANIGIPFSAILADLQKDPAITLG